ncbi:PP2C family protein-serine/threonine phosphatase [Butyrivibrio sp. AE3004]|uniref:PP2C family protein-serine/threonine phosphatase n=1 Tax=Butyrivibrio sp. AE3004 TaxID=1506994 RepID=UPI000691976B|nr:PP2C family protein-serine/threonine phosphatase [Butyrivibrio sp. AE3004]
MDFISKKQKQRAILASIIYLVLLLLSVQFVFVRGLSDLKPVYIFNISGDIFGMFMGYILYICCLIDVQKTGNDLKWFLYLLNAAYFGVFTDSVAWLVDGVRELSYINFADNLLYYLCAPLEVFFFWKYTKNFLDIDKKTIKLIDGFQFYGCLVSILLSVSNVFTKFYFYVDQEGFYHRTDYYLISLIYVSFSIICTLTVIVLERKKLQSYQIVTLFMYVLGPTIVSIITVRIYGLSIINGVIMLFLLLMYCILNVVQGREKAIADRDLALASGIQEHILPRLFPPFPERIEFDLYASMTPAKEVGGDFYDFFMIDQDHLAIVIADVSGKGVPAALFMMVARAIIKNQTLYSRKMNPSTILSKVNNQLCEGNDLELFVTAWLGILTVSEGRLRYANAGHEYPCLKKNNGSFEIVKEKHSPPLAAMEGLVFRGGEIYLDKGDTLYIYTDGVTEATNSKNDLFGTDRMLSALNENMEASPAELDKKVRERIYQFVKDAPQFDDITMLCLKFNGSN